MASRLAFVDGLGEHATLTYRVDGTTVEIPLDSPEWFSWLEEEHSFRLQWRDGRGELVNVTVRPEKRGNGNRERIYWQGWKTISGKQARKYIGRTDKVTAEKLTEIGQWFQEQVEQDSEQRPENVYQQAYLKMVEICEKMIGWGTGKDPLFDEAWVKSKMVEREIEEKLGFIKPK